MWGSCLFDKLILVLSLIILTLIINTDLWLEPRPMVKTAQVQCTLWVSTTLPKRHVTFRTSGAKCFTVTLFQSLSYQCQIVNNTKAWCNTCHNITLSQYIFQHFASTNVATKICPASTKINNTATSETYYPITNTHLRHTRGNMTHTIGDTN